MGPQADVLVVFGITGDLAKLKTLPSLYRLSQRGLLDLPVINPCGTGTTSSPCRSPWPRASASTTGATSTTRSARCATSS